MMVLTLDCHFLVGKLFCPNGCFLYVTELLESAKGFAAKTTSHVNCSAAIDNAYHFDAKS